MPVCLVLILAVQEPAGQLWTTFLRPKEASCSDCSWWSPGPILMRLIGFLPRWLSHWLHSQSMSISHLQLFSRVLWRTSNAEHYKSLCNVGRSLAVSCNLPRHSLQEGIPRLDFLETASEMSFLWKLEPSWHGLSIMVFKRKWKMHLHGPSQPWDFPLK